MNDGAMIVIALCGGAKSNSDQPSTSMGKVGCATGCYNPGMATNLDEIVRQLEQERKRLDSAIQALRGLSSGVTTAQKPTGRRGSRTLSGATRARIAAAQRARWARVRQAAGPKQAGARRGPRRMSAAAKARIAAAQKARWARFRAAKKK